MSAAASRTKRFSVRDIYNRADDAPPLVCLTAYTAPVARIVDESADIILVGDSLGTVLYGYDNTLSVTLDMMICHAEAVVRCTKNALVMVDLPFGSYEENPAQAFRSASRIMKETGCHAVKLEGGAEFADTIKFLTQRGIPVCAHIGMQPQNSAVYGGFVLQGKNSKDAERVRLDAGIVAAAGAFMTVLEAVPRALADDVVAYSPAPVIGIGASPVCDGQILVTEDMAGLFEGFNPKFVRRYADNAGLLREACSAYADDVRNRRFPGEAECY